MSPGRDAIALRDRLLAEPDAMARSVATDAELIGRAKDVAIAERALLDAAAGRSRTLIVSGPAGSREVVAARGDHDARRESLSFRVGHGTSAPVEGAWPYAPVVEALADVCRRHPTLLDGLADHHREEIDRALAGAEMPWTGGSSHQRLFVAAAELVRLASATHGLLLTIDDVHDADDASLRLLHYIARSTATERVCIVLAHRPTPMSETLAETPPEPDRPPRRGRASSSARSTTRRSRCSSLATSPTRRPSCVDRIAALSRRHPVRGERARPPRRQPSRSGCRRSTPT